MTWNTENSEIVAINGAYAYTGTDLRQIPLAGTTTEAGFTNQSGVAYIPNNKPGQVLSLMIKSTTAMDSTVFTISLDGVGVIGTKTVDIDASDTLFKIDFMLGMNTGTNDFSGENPVSIAVTPTTGGGTITFSALFERGLF